MLDWFVPMTADAPLRHPGYDRPARTVSLGIVAVIRDFDVAEGTSGFEGQRSQTKSDEVPDPNLVQLRKSQRGTNSDCWDAQSILDHIQSLDLRVCH